MIDKANLLYFLLDLKVFWLYSEYIASAILAAIKDDQFTHVNFSETSLSIASLNSLSNAPDQLNIATILPTTLQPQHSLSTLH